MKNDTKSILTRFVKRAKKIYRDTAPKEQYRSWTKTARALGVSRGTLIRIVFDGYEPRDNAIRAIIGLPQHVEVMACPKCGKVHTQRKGCGTKKYKAHPVMRLSKLRRLMQSPYNAT